MWLGDHHAVAEAGFFIETVQPSVSRFETLFSNDRREGVGGSSMTRETPSIKVSA
jgi:hypothetical protein